MDTSRTTSGTTSRSTSPSARSAGSDEPTSLTARQQLGARGEAIATDHLRADGWRIVQRNWRLSSGEVRGELDIIACRDDVLAIIEVKTRRSDRFGGAAAAVTPTKQARIRRLGLAFVRAIGGTPLRMRFDVVTVTFGAGGPPTVVHLPGAF